MTSFKYYIADKLKKTFYLGVFLLFIGFVNYGIWVTDVFYILIFMAFLFLAKLIMIPLRGFKIKKEFDKPLYPIVIFTFLFLTASFFDIIVIPKLWVEKFGLSTEGVVVDLRATHFRRRSYVATYEFDKDSLRFVKTQSISSSMYEQLEIHPKAEIKYLPINPDISYLRDLEYLKMNTFVSLVSGIGIMILLYSYKPAEDFNHTSDVK